MRTPVRRGTLIISQVRFLREGLAEILERAQGIQISGQSSTLVDALAAAARLRPAIVLLDAAFPDRMSAVAELSTVIPESNLIVFAVTETENNVLPWAKAGMVRFVPSTGSVNDVISLIEQIGRGEQTYLLRVAGSHLRGVATSGAADGWHAGASGHPGASLRF
jgi:DNA-binding NarL/FixJ family response regulator